MKAGTHRRASDRSGRVRLSPDFASAVVHALDALARPSEIALHDVEGPAADGLRGLEAEGIELVRGVGAEAVGLRGVPADVAVDGLADGDGAVEHQQRLDRLLVRVPVGALAEVTRVEVEDP